MKFYLKQNGKKNLREIKKADIDEKKLPPTFREEIDEETFNKNALLNQYPFNLKNFNYLE